MSVEVVVIGMMITELSTNFKWHITLRTTLDSPEIDGSAL